MLAYFKQQILDEYSEKKLFNEDDEKYSKNRQILCDLYMNLTEVPNLSDSKALLRLESNVRNLMTIIKYELLLDVFGHITSYE